ncbi:MAG TPA: C25 family cysteine peptidase [Kiritimatiellia bacterium]|nr:C25 family cysteine peptidase [Kiritimatiellia bacterium]HMO97745.1 C25 family cysteine peptidase [Kiritimatiellia bacterium]HMP95384.1 C25 family cysteine peptidase [Kiritimatiellia bacterium]
MKTIESSRVAVGMRSILLVAMMVSIFSFAAGSAMAQSGSTGGISDVKVEIRQTGFYRVSKTALASAFGISESAVVDTPFVVANMGREVTAMRDQGDIVFFGHAFENIYTDVNVYWISVGIPSTLPEMTVGAGSAPFASSYTSVRRVEQNLLIRADLIKDAEAGYFEPLFWRMLTSGLSTRFFNAQMALTNVAQGTGGTLKVRLQGATDTVGRYFHRARIDVNGQTQGFIDFEGLEAVEAEFTIASGVWTNGNNIVRIESTPPSGTTFDSFYLDYIEAKYQKTFAAQSNRLFMGQVVGSLQVTGLADPNVHIWNVSDRWQPKRLVGFNVGQAGTNWTASFLTTMTGDYALNRVGFELAPLAVKPVSSIDLRSTEWALDYVTIAPTGLLSASQWFTSYRQGQGLDAATISVDDIYDTFNFGIRDPNAIQSFLSYAYRNWTRSPRYVFLVGDGSLDYKNRLGFNDSLIPGFPIISAQGMYASDSAFGLGVGPSEIAMAVGRLPVTTTAAVQDYTVKVLNYEVGGSWRNNSLVSADINDFAGDYTGIADDLQTRLTDKSIVRANVAELGATASRETLIDAINSGKELSLYVGHGTPNALSLQSILLTADVQLMTNYNTPTAFVLIGCLVGSFGNPGVTNIGEAMVQAKGGVVSLVAAATLISAADGQVLSERLLDAVYQEGTARMGDAWIKGKEQLVTVGRMPAFLGFQLQGDPALAIGSTSSPRPPEGAGPSAPSKDEWISWYFPPVLGDIGEEYDPNGDADNDGVSNDGEFAAGTSPIDPESLLRIINIRRSPAAPGKVDVVWPSAQLRMYRLEMATNVRGPYTMVVENIPASAPVNTIQVQDEGVAPRFYRIALMP